MSVLRDLINDIANRQPAFLSPQVSSFARIIFILGPPGSGKSSLVHKFRNVWGIENFSYRAEVGALLRDQSNVGHDVFEASFEVALLSLEEAQYKKVYLVDHSEINNTTIFEGGFVQNHAHLMTRKVNTNRFLLKPIEKAILGLSTYWVRLFSNSYFLILHSREANKYNTDFYDFLNGHLSNFISKGFLSRERIRNIEAAQVTCWLQNPKEIPPVFSF